MKAITALKRMIVFHKAFLSYERLPLLVFEAKEGR